MIEYIKYKPSAVFKQTHKLSGSLGFIFRYPYIENERLELPDIFIYPLALKFHNLVF